MSPIAVFIPLLFSYCLISRRLDKSLLTAPILFTVGGILLGWWYQNRPHAEMKSLLLVAEIGLVSLLFTDASRTKLAALRQIGQLSARLLSVGMLLTIVLGALGAKLLFPELSWWEVGILSAILAPTDAGLGLVIVGSPKVPAQVRQSLNVEAGLNDGLSVPFLLFFLALATAAPGQREASLMRLVVEQLGFGAGVGILVGLIGGWLIKRCKGCDWMNESVLGTSVIILPVLCLLACEPLGASAFIASFVAGLASQATFPEVGEHSVEFTEEWGQILNYFVFFLFGLLAMEPIQNAAPKVYLYAIVSLTLVRMLPVAVALIGTGLSWATVLFMGWFGPRGLASIVLGLVYLEQQAGLSGESTLTAAVSTTVMLSIVAHGLSAQPGIDLYARQVKALPEGSPERL